METMTRSTARAVRICRETLPQRLADGDPRAPGEMVESFYPELYRYARAMLRNPTLAEDAVHDALVNALVALGKYRAERIRDLALRAWLYRITSNEIRNHFRRSNHRNEVYLLDEGIPADDATDPERVMDVLDALSGLPEKQRLAVVLRYMQDLPYAEISAATGWPENTVKTLVRRGVIKLREELKLDPEEAR